MCPHPVYLPIYVSSFTISMCAYRSLLTIYVCIAQEAYYYTRALILYICVRTQLSATRLRRVLLYMCPHPLYVCAHSCQLRAAT